MYYYDPERSSQYFRELLADSTLPAPHTPVQQELMQKAGIIQEGNLPLRFTTLPPGWQARQTGISQGHLYDHLGRPRARFSYSDDRNYDFQMLCRYQVQRVEGRLVVIDTATETTLFQAEPLSTYYSIQRRMSENFPYWEDPSAYWDDGSRSRPWWKFWA